MRTVIVYASVHHGNTEKLVKSIAEECQVELIDAVKQPDADLNSYDMIGFASGIYFSKFHQSILGFAEKNLPDDKKIFLNLWWKCELQINRADFGQEAFYGNRKIRMQGL